VSLTVITTPPAQSFTVVATPPEDTPEGETPIDVFVTDALGAVSTTHTMTIIVVRTWWQKAKDYVYAAVGLWGLLMTALGSFYYVPFLYNVCRRNSKVIKCPLTAATPQHRFPDGTVTVTYEVRDPSVINRTFGKCLPAFLSDTLTLIETYDGELVPWLASADFVLSLQPYEPSKRRTLIPCVCVRAWSRRGFLLEQFEVDYDTATAGWKFDNGSRINGGVGGAAPAASGVGIDAPLLGGTAPAEAATAPSMAQKIVELERRDVTLREIIRRMLAGESVDPNDAALLGPPAAGRGNASPPPPPPSRVSTAFDFAPEATPAAASIVPVPQPLSPIASGDYHDDFL
jgi:hypothetical protein